MNTQITCTYKGLSQHEVEQARALEGENVLPVNVQKSWYSLAFDIMTEPMLLVLLFASSIYLILGDKNEALFLLGFLLLIIGITVFQTQKTERALAKLRDLSAPRALVIRDGVESLILGKDVVRGDVLILREGDRVAADAVLLDGQVMVDESLLTGESTPVLKRATSEAILNEMPVSDLVFASTVVTKGIALARVKAIGAETEVGKIGVSLRHAPDHQSHLQKSTYRVIRNLTMLGMALASIQILLNWLWNSRPFLESLLAGVALVLAMLPEELSVILTVFFALGAWRLSQEQVLTRRLSAVEALGGISVLAVDKTGTLTHNHMHVAALVQNDTTFFDQGAVDLPEAFHVLVEYAMLATPPDPFDPMEKAIQQFGRRWLSDTEHVHDAFYPAFDYPLTPQILAMTRVFSAESPNDYLLATKGSPEAIIDLCHLPDDQAALIEHQVVQMAEKGLRVLGVARGLWCGVDWPKTQHDFNFEFLGLIGFIDPPRDDVAEAIAECRNAGVRVVMMTGDHPETARAIAMQVGLAAKDAKVITGSEMDALSDSALSFRLSDIDICARLRPEQKLRLVTLLKNNGDVVAMTGDGVNDAPALSTADVGIAMGKRGTDVAREAAALVLLDDRFASIVAAIRQGRRIYDNIDNVSRFIFSVHLVIILLVLVPSALQWSPLLLPVHIVLLQLVIDPACSIVFEAEAAAENVMHRRPRRLQESPFSLRNVIYALVQGVGVAIILLLGYAWFIEQGHSLVQARETIFFTLLFAVFLLIIANRDLTRSLFLNLINHRNPWLMVLFVVMISLLLLMLNVPFFNQVLGFSSFNISQAVSALSLFFLIIGWLALARYTRYFFKLS